MALSTSESNLDASVVLLARFIVPPRQTITSIIQFTNTQNPIRSWDLASQHPTQRRLKSEFGNLNEPVFYAIRRGEWASLGSADRKRFRTGEGRGTRTINGDLLAQFLASFRSNAVVAYKDKARLFDTYFEQTFPPDLRVEEALFVWEVGKTVESLVAREIKKEAKRTNAGERERERYWLMLKRGGRFFVVGVFGLIAGLRNGPDYLRSITEERMTSKRAAERIEKYATYSLNLYLQAVNDLLDLQPTDISTLVRAGNFFDRTSGRIENQYRAMAVNEEWLEGALPKLK